MRSTFLLAAILALAACGKNNQSGAEQNAGDGLTAENIVSNDVTAIDAVTGDAANMAADVDMNFRGLEPGHAQAVAAGVENGIAYARSQRHGKRCRQRAISLS